jgi:spore germination cell wall hydrolase CwlJ-like protein
MPKVSRKTLPPNIVAQILLGEGASEGAEGLQFIRDVMVNRSRRTGKSLEEVATAPKQFSAYARPDLEQFYARQPIMLRNLAEQLVAEAQQPNYQPTYPDIEHYTTDSFFQNRLDLPASHWIHQMEPVKQIGHHVALRPRRRQ